MRYLSVCSGIEAATVAWRPILGWSAVALAEIEPFPCAVLAHHYPKVPNLGDITRFKEWPDLAIDLLVGGTPCQSFSVAGLRKGLADPRGNLALVYLAIASRYLPKWIVWENVPGVLSSNKGRDFGAFLGGMGELGYGWAYRVIDAQHCRVDGFGRAVPQRRRRVFVVGHLGDWRRAAAVLFDAASLHGDSPPRRKAGEEASGRPAYGVSPDCFDRSGEGAGGTAGERSGLGIERELAYSIRAKRPGGVAFGVNRTSGPLDVATAVNAHGGPHGRLDFESETFVTAPPLTGNPYGDHESREGLLVAHSLQADGFDASEDGTGRGTPLVPVTAGTLTGNGDAHSGFKDELGLVPQASAVRRLTPVECARLQGFPDDYLSQVPYRGKPPADGPIYKALGNSMAVNCIRWLGRRIAMVDAIELRAAA